jgi:aspartyl-tRNA(Asn)/glutamyl-tRNA(Gln) amidotransferase subunit B
VERAIRSEIERQSLELDKGNKIKQETRHFQEDTGTTRSGRSKEVAEEYRYFPEPDLVPIAPDKEWIEKLKKALPEQPSIRRTRLAKEWGFTDLEMRDVATLGGVDLIAQTIEQGTSPASARKWWAGELSGHASKADLELIDLKITPTDVARIDALVNEGKLTDKLARQVIEAVLNSEGNPDEVIKKRNLAVVSDDSALIPAIEAAIAANPDAAAKIREGKVQVVGVIVGAVMKTTGGSADAAKVRELVLKTLGQ